MAARQIVNLIERDRYPPFTPTLHLTVVYLIIKAAYTAAFSIMKFKLYKVSSDYLKKSWVVLATDVKDASSQIIFKTKETLVLIDNLNPGVTINLDLKVRSLGVTSVGIPYENTTTL